MNSIVTNYNLILSFDKLRKSTLHYSDNEYVEFINFQFSLNPYSFENELNEEHKEYVYKKLNDYDVIINNEIEKFFLNENSRQVIIRFDLYKQYPNCMLDIQLQIKNNRVVATVYQRSLDLLSKLQQDIEIVSKIVERTCKILNDRKTFIFKDVSFEKSLIQFFVGNAHIFKLDNDLDILNKRIDNCQLCKSSNDLVNIKCVKKGYGKSLGLKSNDTKDRIDFMFVGMNPSVKRHEGFFKTFDVPQEHKNSGFIEILKKLNIFSRSYITNLVKCSNVINKEPYEYEVGNCSTNFFIEEIKLLKPKKIIALGDFVYTRLVNLLKESSNIEIVKINHPSYCFAYNNISYEEYKEQIEKIIK